MKQARSPAKKLLKAAPFFSGKTQKATKTFFLRVGRRLSPGLGMFFVGRGQEVGRQGFDAPHAHYHSHQLRWNGTGGI
jgi:hypothetical protein